MDDMNTDWGDYFDRLKPDSPIYREQSAVYVEALASTVPLHRDLRVLDFGCGFGFVAKMLAPLVKEVWFWDPSPNMRGFAQRNTAGAPNARLFPLAGTLQEQPERIGYIGPVFDLILVNSVAQYMSPEDLWAWLLRWRDMLAVEGKLVLSDLIPPRRSSLPDIVDLLGFAIRHGFALRAAADALGGVLSYSQTSRSVPLLHVGRDDLQRHAADAGLELEVVPRNLTHFRKRWTAVLRRRSRRS